MKDECSPKSTRSLVLLISNKWDLSADYVVRELRHRRASFVRLNTEDLPSSDCAIDLPDFKFLLRSGAGMCDLAESLNTVWYRRPGRPFDASDGRADLSEAAIRYVQDQWHALIDGILSITGVLWINHPVANNLFECKIMQLRKAAESGFRIPRTCITSSKERAEAFIKSCERGAIAKALHAPLIEYPDEDFFVFTTAVDNLEEVQESEISIAPTIFQERLHDKIDYRVTVVGREVFTARIDSGNGKPVPLDWRTAKTAMRFVPYDLPEDIAHKCQRLVLDNALIFGAIDLAQVGDQFFFLEINPNGEWGWLQESAGFPIAEAIADRLVAGASTAEVEM